ncbi:MAG: 1-phosphofructokinase [Acholeplasmataceae bacterium]|nr:1-phosphofructokinase [Acholeplasmataceae bacterium]
MIYTCTMNPSVDYKIKTDDLKLNRLNRFNTLSFIAGGKGINVSIILTNLGEENKAIAFLGGFTGLFIKEELKKKNVDLIEIPIDETTRMNVKIKALDSETELNHIGPSIHHSDFDKLIHILSSLEAKDTLIVGGSGLDSIPDAYHQIAELCKDRHINFVMDTPGRYINEYISYNPLLVKPNLDELEECFSVKMNTLEEIILYGKKVIENGAKNLIISLGSEGSIFINKDFIYQAMPINGEILSTTGAGDSMVAGFIYEYQKNQNILDSFKFAVAASAATVFEETLATKDNILKYLDKVIIKEIIC